MSATIPAHDLSEVRRQAAKCRTIVVFNEPKSVRTVETLLDVYENEAKAFILDLLGTLTLDHYAETLTDKTPPADVYGIFARGWGWYVKVALRHGRLAVISCHPVEAPLRTRSGTITPRP